MRKPLNKIALAVWAVAAITLATEAWIFVGSYQSNDPVTPGHVFRFLVATWVLVRSGLGTAGILVALGATVELLDQIRWNALPPEQRR